VYVCLRVWLCKMGAKQGAERGQCKLSCKTRSICCAGVAWVLAVAGMLIVHRFCCTQKTLSLHAILESFCPLRCALLRLQLLCCMLLTQRCAHAASATVLAKACKHHRTSLFTIHLACIGGRRWPIPLQRIALYSAIDFLKNDTPKWCPADLLVSGTPRATA